MSHTYETGNISWSPDYRIDMSNGAVLTLPITVTAGDTKKDFERGFFRAVAIYLQENCAQGGASCGITSLFRQGGDWKNADAGDIEIFRLHKLIV